MLCYISCVQLWSQGIYIEKRVFPMVYLCWRYSIKTLESLIPYCWQFHVSSFFCNFNALEFCIMEIICILYVFDFCWLQIFFKSSEIVFRKFCYIFRSKCLFYTVLKSTFIFSIYCLCSCFRKTFSKQIFTLYLWNISSVPRNILCFNI